MKLIMENWRSFLTEKGMSQAALGVSDEHYKTIMGKSEVWRTTLPLHVRGFLYYLSGRTKTFTADDLLRNEKYFLKKEIEQRIKELPVKERYVIAYQAGALYPSADISWEEMEKGTNYKFSLFLGQCIVHRDSSGNLNIIDHYDFQNERSQDLTQGTLWKDIKQSWNIAFGDEDIPPNPYVALRTLAPYREKLTDYEGYPVNILL